MNTPFEALCLSGGAIKGILQLGAISVYEENGEFDSKNVHFFSGTSIGSALICLIAIGWSADDIFVRLNSQDTFFPHGKNFSLSNLKEKLGLISIDVVLSLLDEMILEKRGKIPTFRELYEEDGKTLYIVATDTVKQKPIYYSPRTRPNMLITDAARDSCNIPFVFSQRENNVVDGGLVDNFPINVLDNGKRKILAIYTPWKSSITNSLSPLSYVSGILASPINSLCQMQVKFASSAVTIVECKWEGLSLGIIPQEMNNDQKLDMFLAGRKAAEEQRKKKLIYVSNWDEEDEWSWGEDV